MGVLSPHTAAGAHLPDSPRDYTRSMQADRDIALVDTTAAGNPGSPRGGGAGGACLGDREGVALVDLAQRLHHLGQLGGVERLHGGLDHGHRVEVQRLEDVHVLVQLRGAQRGRAHNAGVHSLDQHPLPRAHTAHCHPVPATPHTRLRTRGPAIKDGRPCDDDLRLPRCREEEEPVGIWKVSHEFTRELDVAMRFQ